jgi:hypothetical protein
VFAPDGTSAMYGILSAGLASLAFDGTVTPVCSPSTAPPFMTEALTLDGDGTAYVAGITFGPSALAVAAIRPGSGAVDRPLLREYVISHPHVVSHGGKVGEALEGGAVGPGLGWCGSRS